MKLLGICSSLVLTLTGCVSSSIMIDSKNSWQDSESSQMIYLKNSDVQVVPGAKKLVSIDSVTIDPNKTYRLSGEFRALSKDDTRPCSVHFGLEYKTEDGRTIISNHIANVANSETILTRDFKKGEKELFVADASNWRKTPCVVATKIADDFSDLPNFTVTSKIASIEKVSDYEWKINLTSPYNAAMDKGEKVRQHVSGLFSYNAGTAKITADNWTPLSCTISGRAISGMPADQFGQGVDNVKILLLTNWSPRNDNDTIMLRNVFFKELSPEEVQKGAMLK